MRLFFLIFLTMVAFAANSLLNRVAVESGAASPDGFAILRVASGAAVLTLLVLLRDKAMPKFGSRAIVGAVALSVYLVGFSSAYESLDAGVGALILFGVVQIAMFAFAALSGAPTGPRRIGGAALAMSGLVWIVWPAGGVRIDPVGAVLMGAAGLGWAAYTISGRSASDALSGTAANFCLALPVVVGAGVLRGAGFEMTASGAGYAILSGAVTSGMGYALWYRLLPLIAPTTAATVQLSVPVLAVIGGVVFLGEAFGLRLAIGAVIVLGGIWLSLPHRAAGDTGEGA